MDVTLSTAAMAFVPVIMVLTSLSKNYIDSKYAPLVALVLSLLATLFLVPGETVVQSIFQGVLLSLAASGLYSGGKTIGNAARS